MVLGGTPESERAPRRWFRPALRVVLSICAILSLRWPLPVFWSSVSGESSIDPTVGAFLASFALGALGLPGFLVALWGSRAGEGDPARWWVRGGLVATLAGAVTTGVWIAISVREIGGTLSESEIVIQSVPIVLTATAAIVLRIHVARVTRG